MRRAWICTVALAAASCATPSTPPASGVAEIAMGSAPAASVSYAEDLVAYLGRIRTMSDAALAAEAARMKRDASDLARVKAALALSLTPASEDAEILELVDPVARKTAADRDVRAMASFVQAMATERRRLKQRATTSAGELREERRLAESQKLRAEQLQQKLDALTEVERSLAERETQPR